jgi:RimJ/RimL family protein N-acetyltransferase
MEETRLTGAPQPLDISRFSIIGRQVALGPLRPELLALYAGWRGSLSSLVAPEEHDEPEDIDRWYAGISESDEHAWFTVYELASNRPVGMIGLIDIEQEEKSAEFALHIGEVSGQALELGSEASALLRDYAFAALGLTSLFSMAYEYNLSELRSCETAGFREFTRQRQAHLLGGRLWDIIYLECLAVDQPKLDLTSRREQHPQH